jgi:hypothetical protein
MLLPSFQIVGGFLAWIDDTDEVSVHRNLAFIYQRVMVRILYEYSWSDFDPTALPGGKQLGYEKSLAHIKWETGDKLGKKPLVDPKNLSLETWHCMLYHIEGVGEHDTHHVDANVNITRSSTRAHHTWTKIAHGLQLDADWKQRSWLRELFSYCNDASVSSHTKP